MRATAAALLLAANGLTIPVALGAAPGAAPLLRRMLTKLFR